MARSQGRELGYVPKRKEGIRPGRVRREQKDGVQGGSGVCMLSREMPWRTPSWTVCDKRVATGGSGWNTNDLECTFVQVTESRGCWCPKMTQEVAGGSEGRKEADRRGEPLRLGW